MSEAPPKTPQGRRALKAFGLLAGGLGLGVAIAVVAQVDDWSRDLTQNTAATSSDGPEGLRPLELPLSIEQAAAIVKRAAATLERWELTEDEGARLHFVRTTGLFKFQDDVVVTITPAGEGAVTLHATSASRVGKADFGQNPRNLRALLRAIEVVRSK